MPRFFGEIPGVPPGTEFADRAAVREAGVHLPTQAGISGSQAEGADSIVLSGGYEDDRDYGDVIIYTGQGGNDTSTKKQVAHQELTRGNLALAVSRDRALPVRVVRGSRHRGDYAPATGYCYDGLYYVDSVWQELGESEFRIWRFRLVRDLSEPPMRPEADPADPPAPPAPRVETTVLRIVRNTAVASEVKRLHDYTCQICGLRLVTSSGAYAEGAHIRALGTPENGPDVLENLLCLCPNCHVQFDRGGLAISPGLAILDDTGRPTGAWLRRAKGHAVGREFLRYRAEHSRLLVEGE